MHNTFKLVIISLMICLVLPTLGLAQQVTGAITGLVTDPSGAPVANAAVAATDLDRHTVWPTQTNNEGFYNLPRLPVGAYDIRVQVKGFQTAVHPPVMLEMNQAARVDSPNGNPRFDRRIRRGVHLRLVVDALQA